LILLGSLAAWCSVTSREVSEPATPIDEDVLYCVVAVVDLQGFSAHLEVGGHDLRTTVGQSAVARLRILDEALLLVEQERILAPAAVPQSLRAIRLNDALIFHIDLPTRLTPNTGSTHRVGFSVVEMQKHFGLDNYLNDDDGADRFTADYLAALNDDLKDLRAFVGLVARVHLHVRYRDADLGFSGAKTICCTGFRRRFESAGSEDRLAANFALANAYVADAALHGPWLFVEDGVSELLCVNGIARNVVRYASFIYETRPFDVTADPKEGFYPDPAIVPATPVEVSLFRRQFFFRPFTPSPLTYLQVIDPLRRFLEGQEPPVRSVFSMVRRKLISGPDVQKMRDGILSPEPPFAIELSFRLNEYLELAETGESPASRAREREEMMAELLKEARKTK
jgi:hypothetical protein